MSDDEQSPGSRTLWVGKKKDGPNWFMIAGGAVVMAVSVVFGRRKILSEGEKTKERTPSAGASTQAASYEDDETGSVHTYEAVLNGTPCWDESEPVVVSKAEFESRSFKTKRPAATDPSPQVSKFCRQLSHNSVYQSSKDPVQSVSHTSTALQAGLTARREVVHRLRQQIRSRDAMIYDMQTQVSDQDQMIAMHRNHSVDLQECVQAISTKLFEANLEVQKLHRELMAHRAKPIAGLDEECLEIAAAEIKRQWVHTKDVEDLVLESRKLNEEVERLEREKEAKDSLAQANSRQCELLCKKVSTLATELEEVKTAAQGKQRLLEAKEHENFKLANVLQDLRHKFEIQDRGNEWARSNKLSRRIDACNTQLSWKMNHDGDRPATPANYEEVSSTYKGVVNGNYQQAGSLSKSHGSVHARNDIQQDSEDSVTKAESRCVSDAHTKTCGESADQDGRVNDFDSDEKIDENLILKFDHEVDQVASALSVTSKVVSEQMQAARRILMDFQEHIHSRTDAQPNRSVAQIRPQAWKGAEFSQVLSCLSEGMSVERKQEMRIELEQVATHQDVEREMKVLTKHQTKLRELKCAVAKVTARFNAQNSDDDTSNTEMLQLASSLSSIEQKLAVQEEMAKETSLFIQQLSTLFHLTSQKPPVQEIWRTVKETSGNPTSVNGQQKHLIRFSDEKSRNTLQELDEQSSSRILERQDSSSALRHCSPNRIINTERLTSSPLKLLDNPYQFQLGASSGPISRPRGRTTLAAGRISFRKPATENTVGLKRQSICVGEPAEQNSRDRVTLTSEATSVFSFGLSSRDRPLDNVGQHFSQAAEQQLEAIVETGQPYEQGDRMSSPEPEPNVAHMFREQRLSSINNTSEPSVGNASTFSKRFRSNSGSGTSPNFNSMQSPAWYSSRFGSPQSPCFGVTIDETSSRRPLFTTQTSSPLAASWNQENSDRGFEIKRSTEENSIYNSNPDCSPRLGDIYHASGSVGVSPFAARLAYLDVRQLGSPVGSLRNLETRNERDHHQEDENEDVDVGVVQQSVHSRVTNLVEDRQLNSYNRDLDLDMKDSSGSCNPDEPLTFLPSILRRSNSSNHQH